LRAPGGMIVSFARMNRILEIDIENERALVEPGVVKSGYLAGRRAIRLLSTRRSASQRACTIGGNVAENAGGPHNARARRDHEITW